MALAELAIDLAAVCENWRRLDRMSAKTVETGAAVKADGYGLGAAEVSRALNRAGARTFFVALAEEGATVRRAVPEASNIFVLSGPIGSDMRLMTDFDLTPVVNSLDQFKFVMSKMPSRPFALQLDTGMNRLGLEISDLAVIGDAARKAGPSLVMSHLACAEEIDHWMNEKQLGCFRDMTSGFDAPLSLAATGGIMLGKDYHFDLCRPGIGLYGARILKDASTAVYLDLPVIQVRDVQEGEVVGYGADWVATRKSRIATVSSGYADGIFRGIGNRLALFADNVPCPIVGRISMDLITADVTELAEVPSHLGILNDEQSVDHLTEATGTIPHELLTRLGSRFNRRYLSMA